MANPKPSMPPATDHTAPPQTSLKDLLDWTKTRVPQQLALRLPAAKQSPQALHEAMRYSALAGGKYVRPLLVYATGQALALPVEQLDGPACAVEMIHAYSLIHDDLPAMDDDALRRGKPTCHKAYGEAMAILAGDALQVLAFQVLAEDTTMQATPTQRVAMISMLTRASGSLGMAGGQAIDLEAVGTQMTLDALQNMHSHKTGALILAAAKLGAMSKQGIDPTTEQQLDDYARCIGLAFQIRDDILDIEADTSVLGKTQGADVARNKPTYPALLGLDGAKQKALETHEQALTAILSLGPQAEALRWISDYIVHRHH